MSGRLIAGVTGALLLVASTAQAQVSGPSYVFSDGTVIRASEVNTDFATIYANALNRFSGTMAGALIFTPDNSFDIGASGANRARDFFLGRNASVGGTLTVTGAATFNGAVTFSGGVSSIPETAITDGAILARVAGNETISGTYTFTSVSGNVFESADPIIRIRETDGPADEKRWRLIATGGDLFFQLSTDADAGHNTVWSVNRTGTIADQFNMLATKTVYPVGSVTVPSIALTEAVGTPNDSGFYYAAGAVSIASQGNQVATFSTSAIDLGNLSSTSTNVIRGSTTVSGTSATTALTVGATSATPVVLNRTTSDGTMMDIQRDGVSQGSVSVSGATVAYNTFMGAHYTQLRPGQPEPSRGMVVVSTGEQIKTKPRKLTKAATDDVVTDASEADPAADRFVYTALSSRRNQKGIYGIWHADLGRTAAGMSWGDPDAEVFQVAGLGLYVVLVTDTCGPIHNGDFLATSPLPGLAERQCAAGMGKGTTIYDPVFRDYTLGRARVDVDWSSITPDEDGIRRVLIPVTLNAS